MIKDRYIEQPFLKMSPDWCLIKPLSPPSVRVNNATLILLTFFADLFFFAFLTSTTLKWILDFFGRFIPILLNKFKTFANKSLLTVWEQWRAPEHLFIEIS